MVDPSVFSLTGDPVSIRSSSTKWSTFSTAASTAAGSIRKIDSGDFQGDEAETYRHKMNSDLPPHLDTTSEAWNIVATALRTYANTLEGLQSKMSTLASTADHQQDKVNAANNAVEHAKTADSHHDSSVQAAQQALKPGETLPADTYQAQTSGARSTLGQANSDLQGTIDAANQVKADHRAAVDTCVNTINHAKGLRFEEPPGFWGKLGNAVGGWIKDHADVLKGISSVLKTISGIAGVLALIPVLAPVMGPIALVAGGGALLIDATVKVVTGEGSWGDILFDAATMLPLGKGLKLLKDTKLGASAVKVVSTTGNALKDSKAVSVAGNAAFAVKNRAGFELGALKAGMSNMVVRQPGLALAGGGSVNGMVRLDLAGARAAGATYKNTRVVTVTVNSAKYPESARHIQEAQAGIRHSGNTVLPRVAPEKGPLTIGQRGRAARQRGRDALRDVKPKVGKDRDEYPPKMFDEGGQGASVKYINPSDNRGAGSVIGHQTAGYPPGTKVKIVVTAGTGGR